MKKKVKDTKLIGVSVKLSPDHVGKLKLLGEGFASRGIRVLIDAAAESIPDLVKEQKKMNNTIKFKVGTKE